jgi:hypothetical protein
MCFWRRISSLEGIIHTPYLRAAWTSVPGMRVLDRAPVNSVSDPGLVLRMQEHPLEPGPGRPGIIVIRCLVSAHRESDIPRMGGSDGRTGFYQLVHRFSINRLYRGSSFPPPRSVPPRIPPLPGAGGSGQCVVIAGGTLFPGMQNPRGRREPRSISPLH